MPPQAAHQIIRKFGCDETPQFALKPAPRSRMQFMTKLLAQHPPCRLGDFYTRNFDHTSADNHALAVAGREPITDEIGHLCGR
jgi:hypothetical protein